MSNIEVDVVIEDVFGSSSKQIKYIFSSEGVNFSIILITAGIRSDKITIKSATIQINGEDIPLIKGDSNANVEIILGIPIEKLLEFLQTETSVNSNTNMRNIPTQITPMQRNMAIKLFKQFIDNYLLPNETWLFTGGRKSRRKRRTTRRTSRRTIRNKTRHRRKGQRKSRKN